MTAARLACHRCPFSAPATALSFPLTCACGAIYDSPEQMKGGTPARGPSLVRRAANFTRDATRHARNRGRHVDEATRSARLAACQSCLLYFQGGTCTHQDCGCFMKTDRGFLDALGWESKTCPVGRWNRPIYVRTAELVADTLALAGRLPGNLQGIIANPRGGTIPAALLASHLHLPLWEVCPEGIRPGGHGWRLNAGQTQDGPWLVVDDNQMTGRSLIAVRKLLGEKVRDRQLLYAVVYRSAKASGPPPDFLGRTLPSPIYLEWNLFNSLHSPSIACDFDGVLCRDGRPSEPLYLPRRCEVPLVITGRPEASRASAEQWLATHGVRVKRMVMWPHDGPWSPQKLSREDARGIMAVSHHKAQHYRGSNLKLFVESDDRQAREIAGLTGKAVLCPHSGQVY